MTVKLLAEHHLELLTAQARLSLHLSKCHIVEHHMSRLINFIVLILILFSGFKFHSSVFEFLLLFSRYNF